MLITSRRKLITGMVAALATPAIVSAESLMAVTGDRYFFWTKSLPILPDPMHMTPELYAQNATAILWAERAALRRNMDLLWEQIETSIPTKSSRLRSVSTHPNS